MFDPDNDIADLQDKARKNAGHIYFAGRDAKRGVAIIKEAHEAGCTTPMTFVECDLTRSASAKEATDKIFSKETRLDLLIANADCMNQPPQLTADGYEIQLGTNFLSHALFIKKLLSLMTNSQATRERCAHHSAHKRGFTQSPGGDQ
ncbi:hypothetical protein F4859DRAFT_514615 [Xylaria cf. heliscus]|nr:hypothetical protein F4859DRAFT_514615 [Xylaria cf. heliscus]